MRGALAGSAAPLVVIVADGLYQDVLSQGYHGLAASAFVRVQVEMKGFSAPAWLYAPGAAGAPGAGREASAGTRAAGPGAYARGAGETARSALESFLGTPPDTW